MNGSAQLAVAAALGAAVLITPELAMAAAARRRLYVRAEDVPAADAALVLGAGLRSDGTATAILAARVDTAVALWRAGRVDRLLMSGGRDRRGDEVDVMAARAVAAGVPVEHVEPDHHGVDTYDSCWRARHRSGCRSVVVVTQRFHLGRAVYLARSLGLEAGALVAPTGPVSATRMALLHVREVAAAWKALGEAGLWRRPAGAGTGPGTPPSRAVT
jgi:SanA protein